MELQGAEDAEAAVEADAAPPQAARPRAATPRPAAIRKLRREMRFIYRFLPQCSTGLCSGGSLSFITLQC